MDGKLINFKLTSLQIMTINTAIILRGGMTFIPKYLNFSELGFQPKHPMQVFVSNYYYPILPVMMLCDN